MSIYFITKRKDHLIDDDRINITDDLSIVSEYIDSVDQTGFDKEFNSLNIFRAIPLLTQIGDADNQFIIDDTSIRYDQLAQKLANILLIGHNIKIDYQIHRQQGYSIFRNVYDTMIVEQIINRGLDYSNSLDATVQRRLDIPPLAKNITASFVGMNERSRFVNNQIYYAADDIKHLSPVKEVQQTYIDKRKLYKDLYEIEFPLITILGDSQLKGCKLDEPKWKKNIHNNRTRALELDTKANNLLIELRETFVELKKVYLKREVKKELSVQGDLFMEGRFIESSNARGINFNSSPQVLNIFTMLGLEQPTIREKDKVLGYKVEKPSVKEEALENYLNLNRRFLDERIIKFIDSLVLYKKALKNIGSFGERFLVEVYRKGASKKDRVPGYKSLVTGKVHTVYHQCSTTTTRMSSGDAGKKKKGMPPPTVAYFNSQQIPKPNAYRHCFIADDGYDFTTCDLSGAELVIAASNSGDKRLLEIVQMDDKHSPLANLCYNEIIKYILGNMTERRAREELTLILKADDRLLGLTEEEGKALTQERVKHVLRFGGIEINGQETGDLRTHFKNVTFGLAYGASADRIMEVLGVAKEYALIVESTMKAELPDFFAYQERISKFALNNGYLRFHPDYGSITLFPKILDYKKWKKSLPFGIKNDVSREACNYPIQGTQGLMIKRATVEYFYDYVYPNHYDVDLIFQVHDENVISHLTSEPQHGVMLSEIMNLTADKFLKEVNMSSEFVTMKSWHK